VCCAVLASCSATGFTFQLRPASSTLTPATPLGTPGSGNTPGTSRRAAAAAAGDSEGGSGWDSSDEGDDEEEVTFVPISLGTAEASMPEYLKVLVAAAVGLLGAWYCGVFTARHMRALL